MSFITTPGYIVNSITISIGVNNRSIENSGSNSIVLGNGSQLYSASSGITIGNASDTGGFLSSNVTIGHGSNGSDYGVALGNQINLGAGSVAIGYRASLFGSGASNGVYIGRESGGSSNGTLNTFVGYNSGKLTTTAQRQVIIGSFDGNSNGLDTRTSNGGIVLSEGSGKPRIYVQNTGQISSDANLLNWGNAISPFARYFNITALSGNTGAAAFKNNAGATVETVGVWNADAAGNSLFCAFYTDVTATLRGSIDYDRAGGLTRYNTSSDYRAKDIIGPVQDSGETVDALRVYYGTMKGATRARPMLIAHEAQAVAPYAVSGEKDEVNEDGTPKFQQMDVSSLVPVLIAEIQSLRRRLESLESAR